MKPEDRTTEAATGALEERSRRRRARIEVHVARGFDEAEAWDLEYWQRRTPRQRLEALVAIRRDVAAALASSRERSANADD